MRLLAITTLAVSLFISTGCTALQETNWPKLLECGPTSGELVGTVSEILYNDKSPKQALSDLATSRGADMVVCVAQQLYRDWTAPGASQTHERMAAAANAEAFLNDIGTEVKWQEN